MPSLTAVALAATRTGHGKRQQELRQGLRDIDPGLRHRRNVEKLRLAQLKFQARTADTRRHPPDELQRAIEECAAKLAALDSEIATAMAAGEPGRLAAVASALPDRPDPVVVAEARSALRGRLLMASVMLSGQPAAPVRQMQAAIGVALRRL